MEIGFILKFLLFLILSASPVTSMSEILTAECPGQIMVRNGEPCIFCQGVVHCKGKTPEITTEVPLHLEMVQPQNLTCSLQVLQEYGRLQAVKPYIGLKNTPIPPGIEILNENRVFLLNGSVNYKGLYAFNYDTDNSQQWTNKDRHPWCNATHCISIVAGSDNSPETHLPSYNAIEGVILNSTQELYLANITIPPNCTEDSCKPIVAITPEGFCEGGTKHCTVERVLVEMPYYGLCTALGLGLVPGTIDHILGGGYFNTTFGTYYCNKQHCVPRAYNDDCRELLREQLREIDVSKVEVTCAVVGGEVYATLRTGSLSSLLLITTDTAPSWPVILPVVALILLFLSFLSLSLKAHQF